MSRYEPKEYGHEWLPEGVELTQWEQIEPWYRKLLAEPVASAAELEKWLTAAGELNAAVGEEGVKRYIAMTCQTDDPEREAAYLAFVREIEPKLKPLQNAKRSRYHAAPARAQLSKDRYAVFDRAARESPRVYREANIPRETQLAELEQRYQKIVGAMTVSYRGQERTLPQMAPFLEETDRSRCAGSMGAFRPARRLEDRETLDGLFDQMKKLRIEIAHEAGFADFVEFAFRNRERFDYGAADTIQFHEAVEHVVVPLARQIQKEQRDALGVETLRPWDLSVDRLGRPPLEPFKDVERLAAGTETIFREIDPDLGEQFAFLRSRQLLDLANRKGKAPGGYQTTLEDARLPFIFMNAVGLDSDLRTLLHEGGHAFHTLAARGEPLAAYRESPIEFCEVASMSMELLGARRLEAFYQPAESDRSNRKLLEGIVLILPWIATVDAFQHWIYRHPEPHSRRAQGGMERPASAVRRHRRLVRLRRSPRPFVASSAPHLLVSVLLHRVRHRATGGLADLATVVVRSQRCGGRLQDGRLPRAARGRFRSCSRPPASASTSVKRSSGP